MATNPAAFERALDDAGVATTVTGVDGFAPALSAAVEPPAVGTPLPFDGVSLAGTGVNTTPTASELRAARTGVTPATLGVAEYGSLVLESTPAGDEPTSLYPERHVAVVAASDVVEDMTAAFDRMGALVRAGRDDLVVATGPSATADMGELVLGAHGPAAVHAIVLEDR